MTVCVAIKVHDCIVFAADSAVSITTTTTNGASVVTNVWNHGLKVFNLYRGLPIVAMTAGLANFGYMSITNLAKDLRGELTEEICTETYSLEEVADYACQYFQDEYKNVHPTPVPDHSFEFWIGGYSHDNRQGEIWRFELLDGQWQSPVQIVNPEESDCVYWAGQIQAISRLLYGYDNVQLTKILQDPKYQIPSAVQQQIFSELSMLNTQLVDPSMPVQDAIDLAEFLVDMTKKYSKFLPGANIVSGDTDIATVTKHEGFKWIRRKHYYPPHLNRGETDHAT